MKKTAGILLVFCMLTGICLKLNHVTMNRTSQGCIQLMDFYGLKEHTVDALFVGSSHVYYSINTCMLYNNYGMASYLLASPGQPVWLSYYLLEEAFKTQSPKLVVFDVCTLYQTASDAGMSSWPTLISMKPSVTKWNAIRAVNEKGEQMDAAGAFFSFPYYHTRYPKLTRQDYENTKRIRYNGFKADFRVISKDELKKWDGTDEKFEHYTKTKPLDGRTEKYLRKLIELCQNRGVPVVLVNSPFANKTEGKLKAYNYISLIAQEYSIPFLDTNKVKELRMDYARDLRDPSHLNYRGSMKYSAWLAEWMNRNQKLPDRRGDSRYQNWEEVSKKLLHTKLYGKTLHKMKSQKNYLQTVRQLKECVIVFWQPEGGGITVSDNGTAIFAAQEDETYFKHFDLGHSDLAVAGTNGQTKVLLDKKEYTAAPYTDAKTEKNTEQNADTEAKKGTGTNILIYDRVAKKVIDYVSFGKNGEITRPEK